MKKRILIPSVLLSILGVNGSVDARNAKQQNPCQEMGGFQQGDQSLSKDFALPGYNFSANVRLKNAWDVSGTISYLYWYANQEGMDLAVQGLYAAPTIGFATGPTSVAFQDFKYTSGFKIGLGTDLTYDQWEMKLDYTYLRSRTHRLLSSVNPEVFMLTSWFAQISTSTQALGATSLSSHWNMGLDWIDATLSRPYYEGRKWTVTPFAGLRGSLIRQSINVKLHEILNAAPSLYPVVSHNHSHSWGIGPRAGFGGRWIAGSGIRFQGKMGASLLFSQFSHISHHEDAISGGNPVIYRLHDYNCLRPSVEMGLGMGWGRYLDSHRYHIDLSADYDFNYLWGQNMIRYLNDVEIIASGAMANALFLHGLTVTASVKF